MRWNEKQKAVLDRKPKHIGLTDNDVWCYEEPSGISIYCAKPNVKLAFISAASINAYVRRRNKAKEL